METELGYYLVLISPQHFKIWVRTILDITSFDLLSLDKTRESNFYISYKPVLGVGQK